MKHKMTVKGVICTAFGATVSAISTFMGGWNAGLTTLVVVMIIDYITGIVVAGVFHKSNKTKTGGLNSLIGWQGLCRKGVTFLIVIIACRLDCLIGTNYIRDAVVIAFIANEIISIVENAGLMGIPIPEVIVKAIDVLKSKIEEHL